MKDRKEYWRAYQKSRYQTLQEKARMTKQKINPKILEEIQAKYTEECLRQGITSEHKFWRVRQKIKAKIYQDFGLETIKPRNLNQLRDFLWQRAKARAKSANLKFTITPNDIKLPDVCPIFQITLDYSKLGPGGGSFDAPSVDRINNDQGYTPDNIQVISNRANKLKNDATFNELVMLGAWAKRKLSKIS